MADQIALTADPRPGAGKGEARALRREGRVPAVAYGAGLDGVSLHGVAKDLRHALNTDAGENAIISLILDGEQHLTMPREIHRHPVRRDVLHLDFVAISKDIKVTVEVPLHLVGDGPEGAIVNHSMNALLLEVLPLEVPDFIEVSVDGLEVGDVIRVSDIAVPEGVEVLDDPERTAVSITLPDVEPVEETDEGAAGGVEVIGEDAGEADGADEGEGDSGE